MKLKAKNVNLKDSEATLKVELVKTRLNIGCIGGNNTLSWVTKFSKKIITLNKLNQKVIT